MLTANAPIEINKENKKGKLKKLSQRILTRSSYGASKGIRPGKKYNDSNSSSNMLIELKSLACLGNFIHRMLCYTAEKISYALALPTIRTDHQTSPNGALQKRNATSDDDYREHCNRHAKKITTQKPSQAIKKKNKSSQEGD